MTQKLTFGAEVFALRQALRLTQRALAKAASISPNYLSEIENEKRPPPPPDVCWRLVNALGAEDGVRRRLMEASGDERKMLGTRVARSAPEHVGQLIDNITRLGPRLSKADAQRIERLLKDMHM